MLPELMHQILTVKRCGVRVVTKNVFGPVFGRIGDCVHHLIIKLFGNDVKLASNRHFPWGGLATQYTDLSDVMSMF